MATRAKEDAGQGSNHEENSPGARVYDRDSDGWAVKLGGEHAIRPESERERCGTYLYRGETSWGDHRVTVPGTTCTDVDCHVRHHPTILPGWAEPMDGFRQRPGARAVAAAFWGWDAAGMISGRLGDTSAWVAAQVALDALRDAGFTLVSSEPGEPDQKECA